MPTVLVADDNPDMRRYIAGLLADTYNVVTVGDGSAALEAARSVRPDLVLSDVMMPKLDGYGVVEQIKCEPALQAIPVLAVTALAMVGDRDRMLGAGFDGYISKPIEPETFVQEIEAFLPATLRATARLATAARATEPKARSAARVSATTRAVAPAGNALSSATTAAAAPRASASAT